MKKIGRYDIVEELGRGAMGVVYKAFDPTIGRLVAVKVLSLSPSTEQGIPSAREIFMREARAAGRLAHPGIVTVHDALEDPETQTSYIVMEYVAGRTLEKILASGPPLKAGRALEVIRQVAEALEYAHRQQVIHRDLKPANILLTEDGRVKITDFGIAKIVAREGARRTATIMGTPSYMSPEQVIGAEVDGKSDLFTVGILLYLMLTGQRPFAGETTAVMFKIVYEDPVLPSHVSPELSTGHDYLTMRCLVKERNKRYASAREFLDDLDDVQHERNPRSEAQFPMSALRRGEPTLMTKASVFLPSVENRKASAMKKTAWVIAGVIFLVGLAELRIWRQGQRRPSPVPPATQTNPAAPASHAISVPAPPPPTGPATTATPAVEAAPSGKDKKVQARSAAQAHPIRIAAANTVKATAKSAQPQLPLPRAAASPTRAANPPVPPSPVLEPGAARPAGSPGAAEIWCRHELSDGTLTISSGNQSIFTVSLKGKKKRGFLGIKGGYAGTLARPLKIPPASRELSVRVVTADGSVDLSQTVSATPPGGLPATLEIVVTHDQLALKWRGATHPAP